MDTSINPTQEKSLIDQVVDWASENPLTAIFATLAIGSVGYSMYQNRKSEENPIIRKKHKKKHLSRKQEIQPEERPALVQSVRSFFFKESDDMNKAAELNMPNTIAAATTAVATTAIASTKSVPATVSMIAGGVIAGIGLLTQTPLAMIAGVGLLAGSILKSMLTKTVKSDSVEELGNSTSEPVIKEEEKPSEINSIPEHKENYGDILNESSTLNQIWTQPDFPSFNNSSFEDEDYNFDKM